MRHASKSLLERVEEFIAASSIAVMTVIIAVQVFSRYVLQYSFEWSEEFARYLFIWSVYVGCSYATQKDRHLEVTIFRTVAGGRFAKPVTVLAYLCTIAFCASCAWWGIEMVQFLMKTGQKTPALEIKMYWVFLSVPVGMGLMALRTLERMIAVITDKVNPAAISEI